jgi:hypothetical protein
VRFGNSPNGLGTVGGRPFGNFRCLSGARVVGKSIPSPVGTGLAPTADLVGNCAKRKCSTFPRSTNPSLPALIDPSPLALTASAVGDLTPFQLATYPTSSCGPAPGLCPISMRLIAGILLLIFGIGSISCRWEGPSVDSPARAASAPWVRTAGGWERMGPWPTTVPARPSLHPLVVATGEMLASILGLAAFSTGPLFSGLSDRR